MATRSDRKNMHTIPIADRPRHGSWWNTLMFPLLFNLGILGISTAQMCALPLLLIPVVGRRMFGGVVDWTKDGFGRLLILITVLFAPTSLHISATSPPHLSHLIERDASGRLTKVNLPDRLVIMSNHQAYTDWMYLWALSCYAGHASGMIILLKWSLRGIPFLGWGMRNFRFIFMKRSWAADRENLTKSLRELGARARASGEKVEAASRRKAGTGSASHTPLVGEDGKDGPEATPLLVNEQSGQDGRSPLWLLIFPEGTITSDEERLKSVRYAEREGIPDLTTMLHPRSTGLLFCLRTLLPQVPDLQLLDVTIGYTGVPVGKYPQEYYGLGSIFFRGVPPPSVHVHLHLYDNLSAGEEISGIPSLLPSAPDTITTDPTGDIQEEVKAGTDEEPLASPEEARAFELWLRKLWIKKDQRLIDFGQEGKYRFKEEEQGVEIVKMRQVKWYHWISAMGGGGVGTVGAFGAAIYAFVTRSRS